MALDHSNSVTAHKNSKHKSHRKICASIDFEQGNVS